MNVFYLDEAEQLPDEAEETVPMAFLRWWVENMPGVAQVTAFGPSGMVIIDMLHRLELQVPVVFIDTLHHFDETLHHVENASIHYDLDLHIHRCPDADNAAEFADRYGVNLWDTDPARYAHLTMLGPRQQALNELGIAAWITDLRRAPGGARSKLRLEQRSGKRWRLNPLAYFSDEQVWTYIRTHKVPYNPLHDQGFQRVGDRVTTVPPRQVGEGQVSR